MKTLRQLVPLHASALLLALGFSLPALAADDMFMNNNDIKWGPAPPSLPKGAKAAVLYGDPGKSGPYVIRLMAPPNYKVPPHWHTQAESITVLSGTLYLGTGDKMDTAHAHALKTGGYHYLPGQAHHYAFTKTPTVIQVNADGPFDVTYINPDDDPQKVAKK